MSFADERALLLAKLKIAEAELARLRSANNATASSIAQRAQRISEADERLSYMSMMQGVLTAMPS